VYLQVEHTYRIDFLSELSLEPKIAARLKLISMKVASAMTRRGETQ